MKMKIEDAFYKLNADNKIELYFDGREAYSKLPDEVKKSIKSGFIWGRQRGAWVSRAKSVGVPYQMAGYEIPFQGADELNTFDEMQERKAQRLENKADRFETRAEKRDTTAKSLQSEFNKMRGDWSWLTQPNINSSSGRSFTNQRNKIYDRYDKGMRLSINADKLRDAAEQMRGRASQGELSSEKYLLNRIKEGEKALRRFDNFQETYAEKLKAVDQQPQDWQIWLMARMRDYELEFQKLAYFQHHFDVLQSKKADAGKATFDEVAQRLKGFSKELKDYFKSKYGITLKTVRKQFGTGERTYFFARADQDLPEKFQSRNSGAKHILEGRFHELAALIDLEKKEAPEPYSNWYEKMLFRIQNDIGVGRGDAQAMLQAKDFELQQAWTQGLNAQQTFDKIFQKKETPKDLNTEVAKIFSPGAISPTLELQQQIYQLEADVIRSPLIVNIYALEKKVSALEKMLPLQQDVWTKQAKNTIAGAKLVIDQARKAKAPEPAPTMTIAHMAPEVKGVIKNEFKAWEVTMKALFQRAMDLSDADVNKLFDDNHSLVTQSFAKHEDPIKAVVYLAELLDKKNADLRAKQNIEGRNILQKEADYRTDKANAAGGFDFIHEVGYSGRSIIKTYLPLPETRGLKISGDIDADGYRMYYATDKEFNRLKQDYPNNQYGDKQSYSHRHLNKSPKLKSKIPFSIDEMKAINKGMKAMPGSKKHKEALDDLAKARSNKKDVWKSKEPMFKKGDQVKYKDSDRMSGYNTGVIDAVTSEYQRYYVVSPDAPYGARQKNIHPNKIIKVLRTAFDRTKDKKEAAELEKENEIKDWGKTHDAKSIIALAKASGFTLESWNNRSQTLSFATRENGNVGEETQGKVDLDARKELIGKIRKSFSGIEIEKTDSGTEWVEFEVTFKKQLGKEQAIKFKKGDKVKAVFGKGQKPVEFDFEDIQVLNNGTIVVDWFGQKHLDRSQYEIIEGGKTEPDPERLKILRLKAKALKLKYKYQ
jgi:hypothetical protein